MLDKEVGSGRGVSEGAGEGLINLVAVMVNVGVRLLVMLRVSVEGTLA